LFGQAMREHSGRIAIEYGGVRLSYNELREQTEKAAAVFLSLGHGRSRPVALYLPNVPYHPVSFFGALKTGAPVVHLSPLDAERELAHKIKDSGAKTIVTTNFAGMLANALKLLDQGLVEKVLVGEDEAWGAPQFPLAAIPERPGVLSLNKL